MVRFLLFIKHKCAFLWQLIEQVNSLIFYLCYKKKLKRLKNIVTEINQYSSYRIVLLQKEDMCILSDFFAKQPEEYLAFFKPHKFNYKALVQKNKDKSFIMLGVKDHNQLVAYGFLRCFFTGKSFRGKIVDIDNQGKGIAKLLGETITTIAEVLELRLFATVSKDNIKSIASSKAVNNIRVIKKLPDNYLFVEYLRK